METILKIKDKEEVDKIKEFLKNLTEEEQQQAYIFIQGARIGTRVMQRRSEEPA